MALLASSFHMCKTTMGHRQQSHKTLVSEEHSTAITEYEQRGLGKKENINNHKGLALHLYSLRPIL
jgi:hypothetical protein